MDTGNKTVIFFITEDGLNIAQKFKGLYPSAQVLRFNSKVVPKLWNKCSALVFIMSTGIVIRTIAPLVKNKKIDPAVVVLDEKGKFSISLLSGHLGGANKIAREIADFLDGEAVITTASDVNNMPSIDLWAGENNLVIENWELLPKVAARFLNSGRLRIYIDGSTDIRLPDTFLEVAEPESADLLITNKKSVRTQNTPSLTFHPRGGRQGWEGRLYLRPKNLIIGIGCNRGTSGIEIENVLKKILLKKNLSFNSIRSIATIDIKNDEKGLISFARENNFSIDFFSKDELNNTVSIYKIKSSKVVETATGAYAVAEPAALLASNNYKLLVQKQKMGNVTIAIAEYRLQNADLKSEIRNPKSEITSKLYIVGIGPGSIEHITPYARKAISESDVIVGYGTYLDLVQPLIKDKEIISTGMTQEVDRCMKAVKVALQGKTVSVISGGDPGVYAMAGLVFEMLKGKMEDGRWKMEQGVGVSDQGSGEGRLRNIDVEVIPGIPAFCACAARLGAPLMHDFACISLSDRLTPWELIKDRLESVAKADFVIVLYNPKSKGRVEHINRAREIILKHRSLKTPVGIVRAAMRNDEDVTITNLKDMLNQNIDMQTTVIIGNSKTFKWDKWMITPRGYEKKFQVKN